MEEENKVEEVVTETTEKVQEEVKSGEVKEEKTFTQAELDDIVEKRLAKVKKGIPSKEELQQYQEWKESQKTEAEKNAEKEKEYQKIAEERNNFQRENLLLKKGVKQEDIDYVIFKVSKQEGEFEDNLEQFLTDNPKYLNNYEEPTKTIDLGGDHTEKEADGDAEARKIMGLI